MEPPLNERPRLLAPPRGIFEELDWKQLEEAHNCVVFGRKRKPMLLPKVQKSRSKAKRNKVDHFEPRTTDIITELKSYYRKRQFVSKILDENTTNMILGQDSPLISADYAAVAKDLAEVSSSLVRDRVIERKAELNHKRKVAKLRHILQAGSSDWLQTDLETLPAFVQDRPWELLDEMDFLDAHSCVEREGRRYSIPPFYDDMKVPRDDPDVQELVQSKQEAKQVSSKKTWLYIVRRDIPRAHKVITGSKQNNLRTLRIRAEQCMKELRKRELRMSKTQRDLPVRVKKLSKEMVAFWKKYEKHVGETQKREQKELLERRKREEEMREARRQQLKLNFLLTQTELYSHFVGHASQGEAVSLSVAPDPVLANAAVSGEDEAALQQRAQRTALAAAQRTVHNAKQFDEEFKKRNAALGEIPSAPSMLESRPTPSLDSSTIKQPKILKGKLKEYQLKGLQWLGNLYDQGINGILADEMGLGKTVQAISLMAHLAEAKDIWGPFLVVSPASTLQNWQTEIAKFCPQLKVLLYWGQQAERGAQRKDFNKQLFSKSCPFHVMVTSYQIITKDQKPLSRVPWQFMVLDEAQAIKSSTSQRWNVLLNFKCRNRLLLTGTPVQNSMAELWALLHFIMPTLFDSHDEFQEWFSKDIESHAANATRMDEHQLNRLHMILKPFMLRRLKRDVEHEMAEKIELEETCDLTPRQKVLYDAIRRKISVAELHNYSSHMTGSQNDALMNLVMQFRKVCNHPSLIKPRVVQTPLEFVNFDVGPLPSTAEQAANEREIVPLLHVRSLIQWQLPRLLHHQSLAVYNPQDNYASKKRLLFTTLNIFSADYMFHSLFPHRKPLPRPTDQPTLPDGSGFGWQWSPSAVDAPVSFYDDSPRCTSVFSFLRFCGMSVGDMVEAAQGDETGIFGAFLRVLQHWDRLERYHLLTSESWTAPVCKSLLIVLTPAFSFLRGRCTSDVAADLVVRGSRRLTPTVLHVRAALMPKVVAPPPDVYMSDRHFTTCVSAGQGTQRTRAIVLGLMQPVLDEVHREWVDLPKPASLMYDCGKMLLLDELLTRLKKEKHRVLLYCQMTKMMDILEEYLRFRRYRSLRLDGSSKVSDRHGMVTQFQKDLDIFVFLLSTRAGGLGINLTAADTVIFYDSDWNPTMDAQAMDRAHRLGQTKQVTVYRLVTKHTIEEHILKRAKQKHTVCEALCSLHLLSWRHVLVMNAVCSTECARIPWLY
eukprot:TRINITY_DN2197_c0_g1_i2.p1 TRINITY_DN2197_c0_g1~~TRINITY_DN2197_c0_g1_i2.p1  ORF type:complete len:1221 (-),score=221.20 TRINITY_DN2197_c0_g1_i2:447-4109(-)